jgi:hypothetical protein
MKEFSPEINETLREIRIMYTTRGIEDGFPAPSLTELAAEYDINPKYVQAAFVRQDWDAERKQNEQHFKEHFSFEQKQIMHRSAGDLASRLSNIMAQRIEHLEKTAYLIDSKLYQFINDPDATFKLADLIKLKELHTKEATSIITTVISLKEKLIGDDEGKPKAIGAGEENYIQAVRTAFEIQKALAGENPELDQRANDLFTRLDNE